MRIRITFDKTGLLRYISHLDMMRLMERAGRRAGLPLKLTEGYNPHPKISVSPAVAVGREYLGIEADVTLTERLRPSDIRERLQRSLPREIIVTGVRELMRTKREGKTVWQ